jgi:uncharacterized protein YegP (UPF0339 family)
MARFIIDRNKNGTFEYTLVESDGEVILSGQGYGSKQGCKIGIGSVQSNAASEEQYDRKKGRNGKASFNLLSHNGRVIGESAKFDSEATMEKAIALLKKKAKSAKIVDVSRQKAKA